MPITKASSSAVAPGAKGDLVVGSATNDAAVLGVGSNDQVLTADSSTATGLKWAAAGATTYTNVSITPSFEQNSTVTSTNDFSGYISIPNFVYAYWKLTATGSGTSGNQIGVTLTGIPTGSDAGTYEIVSGMAEFYDSSANLAWRLAPYFTGGTSLRFSVLNSTSTSRFGTTGFTGQVDSGDVIEGFVVYRKA